MNDRGAGPVSEASGCGGAAVTCGGNSGGRL